MKEFKIKSVHLPDIHVYKWNTKVAPVGVIQIAHGLNEHGLRYAEFAEFMSAKGYIVYCHDHISQGKTRTDEEETVYFGKNGVENLTKGVQLVRENISIEHPTLPVYGFGHSMGAAILRYLAVEGNAKYQKLVLNGTGESPTKGLGVVIGLGKVIRLFGPKKPSKFFDNLFRQTQYKLREKVQMDHFIEWLTRDKEKTKINLNDEYLYIRLSVSAFINILEIMKIISNQKNILKMDNQIKYFIMSGTHDPATNFGVDAMTLFNTLQTRGCTVQLELYPEGRHDTLQETNRNEVFQDILEFIQL